MENTVGSTFLIALVIFIALCGITFSIVSYLLYWYEHQSSFETIFASKKEAAAATQAGIATGAASQALAFTLLPYGALRQIAEKNTPKFPTADPTPVIFVHGLFHNSSAWILYKRWFSQHGYTNCSEFYYSSSKPFAQIASELDAYLNNFFEQHPDARPVLIGHSLGGLLLRNWIGHTHHNTKPLGVITLGAPMHGSRLATFSFKELGKTLDYRGELIRSIENEEKQPQVPCFALYSPVDNMVLPQSSVASPPKGWDSIRTKPVSHIAMLSSKEIARQVVELMRLFPR